MMSLWEQCKKDFEPDGALRDISILNTTLADWDNFLLFIQQQAIEWSYSQNNQVSSLPPSALELFAEKEKNAWATDLSFWVDTIQFNSFFFSKNSIDIDISPDSIVDEPQFCRFVEFIKKLGTFLNKDVFLSHEGAPDCLILQYNINSHTVLQEL